MNRKTVQTLLIKTLILAGVIRIFSVAGDSLNGMADTVRDSKDISWVSLRHKDWAAFADGALNQVLDIKDAIDLNKSQSYVEYLSLAKEQSLWRLSHEIQKWDGRTSIYEPRLN